MSFFSLCHLPSAVIVAASLEPAGMHEFEPADIALCVALADTLVATQRPVIEADRISRPASHAVITDTIYLR
jgi:hypothetical protein